VLPGHRGGSGDLGLVDAAAGDETLEAFGEGYLQLSRGDVP
jgi:hypothetical protein